MWYFILFSGKLLKELKPWRKMEEQETMNDRPTKDIKITNCGALKFEF